MAKWLGGAERVLHGAMLFRQRVKKLIKKYGLDAKIVPGPKAMSPRLLLTLNFLRREEDPELRPRVRAVLDAQSIQRNVTHAVETQKLSVASSTCQGGGKRRGGSVMLGPIRR
jgi:hypothetical protein